MEMRTPYLGQMTLRVDAFAQTINFISQTSVPLRLLLPLHCQCQRGANALGLFIICRWTHFSFAIKATTRNETAKKTEMGFRLWRPRLHNIYCFSSLHRINSRSRRATNQIFNNSVHVCRRWFRFRFVSFSILSGGGVFDSFAASVCVLCVCCARFFFNSLWVELKLTFQSHCAWDKQANNRKCVEKEISCVTIAEFQYFNSHSNSCTLTLISPANFAIYCVAAVCVCVRAALANPSGDSERTKNAHSFHLAPAQNSVRNRF